jgi:hypothetical protein
VTAYAWVVICTALAACGSSTPTARERALAQLPGDAGLVATADGPALGDPTIRRVIDAARSHLPRALDCLVDVAQTGEAIAIASSPGGVTIAIITRAVVARCPALSQINDDTYVATIGEGALATSRSGSVLSAARWAPVRGYLKGESIAIAAFDVLGAQQIVFAAQPAPLDAWLAIDTANVDRAQEVLELFRERWRTTSVSLATRVRPTRTTTQLLVQVERLEGDDLVTIASDALTALERSATPRVATVLACPPIGRFGITSCRDGGTTYEVTALALALVGMTGGEKALEPHVAGGDIAGLRLTETPVLGVLRKGDVVVGLGTRRLTRKEQFSELVAEGEAEGELLVTVRREGVDFVLRFSQVE